MDEQTQNTAPADNVANEILKEETVPPSSKLDSAVPPTKPHSTIKIVIIVIVFLIILAAGIFFFLTLKVKTSASESMDADLQKTKSNSSSLIEKSASNSKIAYTDTNNADNGYETLQKIKKLFVFNPETKATGTTLFKMGNGEVWDENLAKEYLDKNQEALQLLSELSTKKSYIDPMYQNITKETVASTTPDLTFMKNLLTVSNIDFENALRLGDVERASTLFFERLTITNLLLSSNAEELSSIRASALRNQALTSLLPRLLAKEKLSASSSLLFESKIRSSPVPTSSYYAFLDTEAKIFTVQNNLSIEELAANQKDKRVTQVLQMAADTALTDFKAISKVYADETKKSCTEISAENVRSAIEKITTKTGPNKEAESFFDDKVKELFEPKLLYLTRKCTDEIATESALALIGIKAYSDEKGVLPDTIAALTPTYLITIPIDPYDQKPFKYNKEKDYVYSLGEDSVDNGGSNESVYWSKMNDPTFRVVR